MNSDCAGKVMMNTSPWRVSSVMPTTDRIAVLLISMTYTPLMGCTIRRMACGRTTSHRIWSGRRPRVIAPSVWPRGTAWMAPMTISAT